MARRTFKALHDSPEFKKGTIIQEMCDDGTQDYEVINRQFLKFPDDQRGASYARPVVEKQPYWFEEVFPASEMYMTKDELKKFKAFVKAGKK